MVFLFSLSFRVENVGLGLHDCPIENGNNNGDFQTINGRIR